MNPPLTAAEKLKAAVASAGGEQELLDLLDGYRKIVAALATSQDPRRLMCDVRCWFSRKVLLQIAMDLNEEQGRAFLGR